MNLRYLHARPSNMRSIRYWRYWIITCQFKNQLIPLGDIFSQVQQLGVWQNTTNILVLVQESTQYMNSLTSLLSPIVQSQSLNCQLTCLTGYFSQFTFTQHFLIDHCLYQEHYFVYIQLQCTVLVCCLLVDGHNNAEQSTYPIRVSSSITIDYCVSYASIDKCPLFLCDACVQNVYPLYIHV